MRRRCGNHVGERPTLNSPSQTYRLDAHAHGANIPADHTAAYTCAVTTSRDSIILERRFVNALAALTDDSLTSAALALDEELRDLLAQVAGLGADAFEDTATLAERIRDGAQRRRCAGDVCVVLCEPCTRHCIETLGSASDDPTLDDLQAILPDVLEKFGLEVTKLMVIQYSLSLQGFKKLISADERFALPVSQSPAMQLRVVDEEAQAAKRAARKARRAADKAKKK